MDKILNYQVSLFGQFMNIKPEQTLINKLLSILKDFLPGVTNVSSINILTNQIQVEERMQFVSSDRSYTIVFLPDRIDICYIYNPSLKNEKGFDEIIKKISELLSLLNNEFPTLPSNRLATSCNCLSKKFDTQDFSDFINSQTNKDIFFKDKKLFEWGIRYNSKFEETISEKAELTNHIIDIKKAFQNNSETNQFVMLFDINTDPTKISNRFAFTDLINFQNTSNTLIKGYINAIEG